MRHFNKVAIVFILYFSLFILPTSIVWDRFNSAPKDITDTNLTNPWKIGENIHLDWYIGASDVEIKKKWSEYPILKEVSGITGVEPNVIIPTANKSEKLDLMVASNDFPDLLTLDTSDVHISKLLRFKKLYSLDELIEKYVPQFKNEIDAQVWKDNLHDDYKLYGLPGNYIPEALYNRKTGMGVFTYNVKKDIYEALGSPDMSTPDSFITALRLFKQRYPRIEGKPSIPVSLFGFEDDQITMIERSFGVKEFYEDKELNLKIKYKNPGYIEIIKFLNGLYREELMDPQAFIKKHEQIEEDLEEGRVFSAPMRYHALSSINVLIDRKKNNSHYIAVKPMQNNQDVTFPGKNRFGLTFTMIPRTTGKPGETIKFVRYMWSKEGNVYFEEQYPKDIEGDQLSAQQLADRYLDSINPYLKNLDPDDGLPIGRIKSKVEDIIRKVYPTAIMAQSEDTAVAIFESMMLKLEQAGLEKLEIYWTDRYKINLSR